MPRSMLMIQGDYIFDEVTHTHNVISIATVHIAVLASVYTFEFMDSFEYSTECVYTVRKVWV